MSKENFYNSTTPGLVGQEEITAEQRARISQKFRAAKALRARKRPRCDAPSFTHHHENTSAIRFETPVARNKRVPLMDVSVNTPSHVYLDKIEPLEGMCSSESSSKSICIGRTNLVDDSFSAKTACPIAKGYGPDSFITPLKLKQPESYNLGDSFPTSSILDDDEIDELILEEIDAICQEQSAANKGNYASNPDTNLSVENQCTDNQTGDLNILMDLVADNEDKTADSIDCVHGLECKEETICTSHTKTSGNMPEEFSKYLQSLNDQQREAACGDISTPLMIIAGPGSGKTSTMVGRILMLINEGISPSNILAMTFTTAAASEMRDRVGAVAGKSTAKEITISTFHSFSLQLCRSHAEKLGRTPEFLIFGHGQQRRAVIEAVRLLEDENRPSNGVSKLGQDSNGISSPQYFKDKSKKWLKFVTQAKASGKTPAECHKLGDEMGATILRNYENTLSSCDALDYHDLISCSVKLLTDFPEVFEESQKSWKAIVVDEFQDTSAMQYNFLRVLASHKRITIVGDDDQSIFSFNGADISGFDSFRKDFPNNKEIRLNKNYRSTRTIVEAASCLIQNNMRRCKLKNVLTDNSSGSKVTIKECHNEDAQCAFVVDKILETISNGSGTTKCSYGNIAILYRRQVSGKVFQTAFRDRKIPFNIHGVAFYRKKVVKAIIAMLRTTVPDCDDGPYRQVFKTLLPFEKEEKKRMIGHIEKISTTRKCSFISAACDIFGAKISGTFKRSQLTQGRKVLLTLETISKLAHREQSISVLITSVANMLPQKYLLEQRAVVDADSGKLLNEDNDLRSVLQYLLDDISNFLSNQSAIAEEEKDVKAEEKVCIRVLKAFIDFLTERERENFRSRRHDNENSVTLTTIHQSKGLEWDVVFIVKANDSEIPLLHEFNGAAKENGTSVEEERRLLYVAMTRARKKLFILYVMMDPNWQLLQPSRFLKEIPAHLLDIQAEISIKDLTTKREESPNVMPEYGNLPGLKQSPKADSTRSDILNIQNEASEEPTDLVEVCNGNGFLKRFCVEERSVVSHLFHQWAKKRAFQDPKRLLVKVGFVIDERLRVKKNKHKDVLLALKSCLSCDEAFQYAEYVLRWEQIPADIRANMMREKQEHFLKLRIENSMGSSEPTPKQIAYLQSLGCTVAPTSRLHASRLIEQYKSL